MINCEETTLISYSSQPFASSVKEFPSLEKLKVYVLCSYMSLMYKLAMNILQRSQSYLLLALNGHLFIVAFFQGGKRWPAVYYAWFLGNGER